MATKPKERLNADGSSSWFCDVKLNGIRQRVTRDSSRKAELAALQLEQDILDGKVAPASTLSHRTTNIATNAITVDTIFKRYIKERLNPSDEQYKRTCSRIEAYSRQHMSGKPMGQWTIAELEACVDRKGVQNPFYDWINNKRLGLHGIKKVKDTSIRREHTVLSTIFRVATDEWQLFTKHPMTGVKKPAESPPREEVWTPEDIEKICKYFKYVPGTVPRTQYQEVALAFLIGLHTLQRTQEILTNIPRNLNLEERVLWIPPEICKIAEGRTVSLVDEAIELYKLVLQIDRVRESDYFKGHKTLFNVSSANKDQYFREAKQKSGLAHLRFHDTRRTGATALAEHLTLAQLMAVGGWKKASTLTRVYNRVEAKKTAQKLAGIKLKF
jgi:integrase